MRRGREGLRAGGGDRKGRGNPRRFEHPLFRKTESLPGQLLRSHHKLKSCPPAPSVPFLTALASSKLQLVPGSAPLEARRSGVSSAPCLPAWSLRTQPPRFARAAGGSAAQPGLPLTGGRAGARGSRVARPQPAPPSSLSEKILGKERGREESAAGKTGSGHLLLQWEGALGTAVVSRG